MIHTSIKSMRFPPEMEKEFQRRYHLRAAKNTQLMMLLAIVIYQAGTAFSNDPWYMRVLGFVGPAVGWILCEIKAFHKFAQTAGTLGYVAFFIAIDYMLSITKPLYVTGYTSFIVMMNVFVLYTMMRMFLVPSIIASIAISVAHIILLQSNGASGETVETTSIGLIIANVIGVFASYNFERNFRRMFADKEVLSREHKVQERLLENILPREIGSKLRSHFQDVVIDYPEVIVLSADLANFTAYSARVSAGELVAFLNEVYTEFDALADLHKMTKIKTMGDAVILATGIHAAPDILACVKMAVSMRASLQEIELKHNTGVDLRIGIAHGPCSAGVVGELRPKFDLWGPAVTDAEALERKTSSGSIAIAEELRAVLSTTVEGRHMLARADRSTKARLHVA